MTHQHELLRFIQAARQNGISDSAITSLLEANGWPSKHIFTAMREHYEAVVGMPVPVRRGFEGARDAFLQLLSFGTLSVWTIALGALIFGLIERTWPDPVMARNSYERFAAAGNLASLIVAFPVYLLATRQILREAAEEPEKRDSGVRRWLTWLALLVAAGVVIGDLITVLTWLLRGEFTVRFLLKALTVFVLAAGVFWFYLAGLRETGVRARNFAAAATAAVLVALAGGFSVLGSPSEQRGVEADRWRVEHMREITTLLQGRADLPEHLAELPIRRADPVSGQPYGYRKLGATRFEICAEFQAPDDRMRFWSHGAGRQCFFIDTEKGVPH